MKEAEGLKKKKERALKRGNEKKRQGDEAEDTAEGRQIKKQDGKQEGQKRDKKMRQLL